MLLNQRRCLGFRHRMGTSQQTSCDPAAFSFCKKSSGHQVCPRSDSHQDWCRPVIYTCSLNGNQLQLAPLVLGKCSQVFHRSSKWDNELQDPTSKDFVPKGHLFLPIAIWQGLAFALFSYYNGYTLPLPSSAKKLS